MVHALWVDRIVADVRADQQAAQIAQVMGARPEWPSLEDRLTRFEDALTAEPTQLDPEDQELRDALGLRRRHG